jgi:hypothetical protein
MITIPWNENNVNVLLCRFPITYFGGEALSIGHDATRGISEGT